MTIQEQIDALPDHSGGTIHIEKGMTVTEPIRVVNKSFVTIRGPGAGSAIVGDFATPGPLFYVAGSPWFKLADIGLQQVKNVECGVLGCRTDRHNGPQSSSMVLDGLNIQGEFLFGCVATVGCDAVTIRDCRLNPRTLNSYGWWTGSEVPRYRIAGTRPGTLGYNLPVYGGSAVGERMIGGYVASNAKDITSIRIDDGVVQGRLEQVFISNSPTWNPDGDEIGFACISLGKTHHVVIDNVDTESADCEYGVLVDGVCTGLSIRNGRYQGRLGLVVSDGGGLINSRIDRTASFETLDESNQCPIVIERGARIQNTVLDIGGYVND